MEETFKNLNDGDIFIIISNDTDEKKSWKRLLQDFYIKIISKNKNKSIIIDC